MTRTIILLTIAIFAHLSCLAQERSTTIKASDGQQATRDKAAYVASVTPNITLNGNACKTKDVTVTRSAGGKYSTKVRFSENCSGMSEASFDCADLKDAIEVKDIISNFNLYQSFDIKGKKDEPLSFEVVYKNPRIR
jgi:hypothetical protein